MGYGGVMTDLSDDVVQAMDQSDDAAQAEYQPEAGLSFDLEPVSDPGAGFSSAQELLSELKLNLEVNVNFTDLPGQSEQGQMVDMSDDGEERVGFRRLFDEAMGHFAAAVPGLPEAVDFVQNVPGVAEAAELVGEAAEAVADVAQDAGAAAFAAVVDDAA